MGWTVSWVKLDDKLWCHPKFVLLSCNAVTLWTFGLCWCNQYETDGRIPKAMLPVLRSSVEVAQELVAAGLWRDLGDGWQVHDYLEYQPVVAPRQARRGVRLHRS